MGIPRPQADAVGWMGLWMAMLVGGCGPSAPVEDPVPEAAILDVMTSLDEAAERAMQGDATAVDAWSRAHDRFEAEVEPALRRRASAEDVARTEYQFARIHAALAAGDASAQARVDALGTRLREQFRSP